MTAARRFGPSLEALHVFIAWAAPVVDAFPRSYKSTPRVFRKSGPRFSV
jgi:hypothetical protein